VAALVPMLRRRIPGWRWREATGGGWITGYRRGLFAVVGRRRLPLVGAGLTPLLVCDAAAGPSGRGWRERVVDGMASCVEQALAAVQP
jgi:hypothetical protein